MSQTIFDCTWCTPLYKNIFNVYENISILPRLLRFVWKDYLHAVPILRTAHSSDLIFGEAENTHSHLRACEAFVSPLGSKNKSLC